MDNVVRIVEHKTITELPRARTDRRRALNLLSDEDFPREIGRKTIFVNRRSNKDRRSGR